MHSHLKNYRCPICLMNLLPGEPIYIRNTDGQALHLNCCAAAYLLAEEVTYFRNEYATMKIDGVDG